MVSVVNKHSVEEEEEDDEKEGKKKPLTAEDYIRYEKNLEAWSRTIIPIGFFIFNLGYWIKYIE